MLVPHSILFYIKNELQTKIVIGKTKKQAKKTIINVYRISFSIIFNKAYNISQLWTYNTNKNYLFFFQELKYKLISQFDHYAFLFVN